MALTFILLNVLNWLNQLFFCRIRRKTEGNSLLKFLLKQNQHLLWQFHIQLIQLVRQKLVRQRVLWSILFLFNTLLLYNNPFLMKVMLYWHWIYFRKIVNVILTFIPNLSLTNFNFKIEHTNISKGKASNFIVLLGFRCRFIKV